MLDVLPGLIVIIAVSVILTAFIYLVQVMSCKEDIRQIARDYLLDMETTGYLTSAGRTSLLQELSDKGMESIDLLGTTQAEVGYGSDIVLSVQGRLPMKALKSSGDMFSFFFEDVSLDITIYLQSTAKN